MIIVVKNGFCQILSPINLHHFCRFHADTNPITNEVTSGDGLTEVSAALSIHPGFLVGSPPYFLSSKLEYNLNHFMFNIVKKPNDVAVIHVYAGMSIYSLNSILVR